VVDLSLRHLERAQLPPSDPRVLPRAEVRDDPIDATNRSFLPMGDNFLRFGDRGAGWAAACATNRNLSSTIGDFLRFV
jgi:hypothetical protein